VTPQRLTLVALASLTFASAYPMQVNGWNQNAHYALVRALADGTPRIDASRHEVGELGTGDVATFRGHVYSNKAPGLAFATMPAYAVTVASGMRTTGDPTRVIWALHLWGVTLEFLVLLLLVRWAVDRLEPGFGLTAACALGASTLVLPFSTLFFAHVLSTMLGFAAFAVLLYERRAPPKFLVVAVAGLLAGLAVTTEYSLVLIAAVVGVYALRGTGGTLRRGVAYAAGVAVGVAPVLLYNTWAFGFPLHSTYDDNFAPLGGLLGMGTPSARLLYDILFSAWGIVTLTPVVIAGVAGAVVMWRRGIRAEALVLLGVVAVVLAWAACFRLGINAFGGLGAPRYLMMVMPFAAVGLGAALKTFPLTTLALGAISAFQMVLITATNPLASYDGNWLERVQSKTFSQTALGLIGITGWYAIVLFFAAVVLAIGATVVAAPVLRLQRRELALAAAALVGWAVVAFGAQNPVGLAPSTTYVLALVFVVGVVAAAIAFGGRRRPLRRAPAT
jgi:hypothetical protein